MSLRSQTHGSNVPLRDIGRKLVQVVYGWIAKELGNKGIVPLDRLEQQVVAVIRVEVDGMRRLDQRSLDAGSGQLREGCFGGIGVGADYPVVSTAQRNVGVEYGYGRLEFEVYLAHFLSLQSVNVCRLR